MSRNAIRNFLRSLKFIEIPVFIVYSVSVITCDLVHVAIPYVNKLFIDTVLIPPDSTRFVQFIILICALQLAHRALLFCADTFYDISMINLTNNARKGLVTRLFHMGFAAFRNHTPEKINSLLVHDVANMQNCTSRLISILISDSVSIILVLTAIASFNTVLSIVFLALVPVQFIILKMLNSRIRRYSEDERDELDSVYRYISDVPVIKEMLKLNGKIRAYLSHVSRVNRSYRRKYLRTNITLNSLNGLNDIVTLIGYAIVMVTGGLFVVNSSLSLGSFVALVAYYEFLSEPIARLVKNLGEIRGSFVSLGNVFRVLDDQEEDQGSLILPDRGRGTILSFRDVSFSHTGHRLIEGFSGTFTAGCFYRITAPSGRGKTTLLKLITLLERDYSGSILVNDCNIKDIGNLYQVVNYLPQATTVFNASIRANVTLFDDSYTVSEIEEKLAAVNLLEEFRRLPGYLDEEINIKDGKLSGGQLRRLGIARMLLLKPDAAVYLLDEPFAGLDPVNARLIFHRLREILEGRMVIITSHDTLLDGEYDRIIEL